MRKAAIIKKWDDILKASSENKLKFDYADQIAQMFDDHIVSIDTVASGKKKFLVGEDIFQVKDKEGNSLIHKAAKMKNIPLICYLISQGVDPDLTNNEGKTYRDLDEMKALVKSLPSRALSNMKNEIAEASTLAPQINSISNCSDREFLEASSAFLRSASKDKQHITIIQTKVDLDDIDRRVGSDKETLLHAAALNGQDLLVKELIRRGASCSKTTITGITPLMSACMNGSRAVVKEMIKHGHINDVSSDGSTALHAAVLANNHHAIKLLLKQPDIDVSILNKKGQKAADLCKNNDIKELIQEKEVQPPKTITEKQSTKRKASSLEGEDFTDLGEENIAELGRNLKIRTDSAVSAYSFPNIDLSINANEIGSEIDHRSSSSKVTAEPQQPVKSKFDKLRNQTKKWEGQHNGRS